MSAAGAAQTPGSKAVDHGAIVAVPRELREQINGTGAYADVYINEVWDVARSLGTPAAPPSDGQPPNGQGFAHRGVAAWRDGDRLRIILNSRYRLIQLDAKTGASTDDAVYIAWEDDRDGSQVYAARSLDAGVTFSTPIRASSDAGAAVSGATDEVSIAFLGSGTVVEHRLYQLLRQSGPIVDRTLDIEFLDAGVEAFSFTFG